MKAVPMDVVWRRSPDVAFVDSGERIVLVDLSALGSRPQLLTGPGAAIWRILARPAKAGQVLDGVAADFGAEVAAIRGDVSTFLHRLADARLILPD